MCSWVLKSVKCTVSTLVTCMPVCCCIVDGVTTTGEELLPWSSLLLFYMLGGAYPTSVSLGYVNDHLFYCPLSLHKQVETCCCIPLVWSLCGPFVFMGIKLVAGRVTQA